MGILNICNLWILPSKIVIYLVGRKCHLQDILQFFSGESKDYKYLKSPDVIRTLKQARRVTAVNKQLNFNVKVLMKRKLSFSYLNELLRLLGMLIWRSFIYHVVLGIFRLV